jgi:lipoprotein-releasing system ATP-binding protein
VIPIQEQQRPPADVGGRFHLVARRLNAIRPTTMSSPPPILDLKNVNKVYPSAGEAPVEVLRDIDLTLEAGSSTAIVGPSGSGKSTLLQIIGTLDRATSGTVRIAGQDVAGLSDDQLAELRSRMIGFVFQMHHLLPHCTALENVLVPVLANSKPGKDTVERARKLLDRVGLSHRLNHLPGQMSGGERQRTAIVRALINQPKLLLADEPTGALDRASAEALAVLLAELNREEKVTLIVVTHAPELAATMDRTLRIEDGRLL